jgi:hypothetical protein
LRKRSLFDRSYRTNHGRVMGRAAAWLFLALPLAGCLSDQKRDIAQCELAGSRLYPTDNYQAVFDRDRYTKTCMAGAGYRWAYENSTCKETANSQSPYCYEPSALIERLILRLEQAIGGTA